MNCRTANRKTSLMIVMVMLMSVLAAASFVNLGTDDSDATDVDCESYYFDQLSPLAKSIYNGVKTAEIISENYGRKVCLTFTLDVDSTLPEADRETAYSAALADVLEIYDLEQVRDIWITKDFTFEISEDKVVFTNSNLYIPMFEDSREDFAESLEEAYRDRNSDSGWIIDTACRYTIVKSAHDYLCKSVSYRDPVEGKMKYNNIYDVFSFPNYASDRGIAKAMKDICDEYGIPCIVVPCTGNNGESDLSYCNYVQMDDGNWYVVAPKWDIPSPSWDPPATTYLLAGSGALDIISPVSDFTLPPIAENGYSDNRVMIRFVDYDGSYLPESNMYVKGSELNTALTAGYTNDKIGTFTFTGWDKTIPANATEDMTFQAQYIVQFVEYTYIFVDEQRAKDYIDWLLETRDKIKSISDKVTKENRKNVLITNYASSYMVDPESYNNVSVYADGDTLGQAAILAGAKLAAEGQFSDYGTGKMSYKTDTEWLAQQSIDYMFMHTVRLQGNGKLVAVVPDQGYTVDNWTEFQEKEKNVAGHKYVKMAGLEEDNIYMLAGDFRNNASSGILLSAYMVKILYPELCGDFDPYQVHQDYMNWMGKSDYDITQHGTFIVPSYASYATKG